MDQDYSSLGHIPNNIVMGNNLESYTTSTLNYDGTAGAIEYKTIRGQVGSLYVGIEPFINGNLSISLKVNSDDWNSNVYICGSTFWLQTQTRDNGDARVYSFYHTSPTALGYDYYDVPADALVNGVNTINIMISGTTKTLKIYYDNTYGMTTPMDDLSVRNLPYAPITKPTIVLSNEVSSLAAWSSIYLYGIKETVHGGLVSSIPGNDFLPFGIDGPSDSGNALGTQYMSSHGQRGVAWVDVGCLAREPQQIEFAKSLLNAGWELGIHYSVRLTDYSMSEAQAIMQDQYDQVTAIFGRSPTSWCSLQNADTVDHAVFAYNQLGMMWRNGYSGIDSIVNIGNLQDNGWSEFWSKISTAQIVYPCFTHQTDQSTAVVYSISYSNFINWVDNYNGKHIIGFDEYYHRVLNQIDTKVHYLNYVEGKTIKFSVECNEFQSRLLINFPVTDNTVVLKNGVPLVRGIDYSVVDGEHIVLFTGSNAVFEITSAGALGTPENLKVTPGGSQATLAWSAPASDGGDDITGYKIYRSVTSGSETLIASIGNVLTYTDTSLAGGATYYYKVSAVNSNGEGPLSSEASTTLLPTVTVTSPTSSSVLVAGGKMTVTWSSAGTVPGLMVELLKGGTRVLTLATSTTNDGTQAFTLPFSLAPGTDYTIRLTATNNPAVTVDSGSFTIRAPAISVTYPNGGETLVNGASVGIRWTGDMSLLGQVSITLWQNGKLVSTISSGTANDGSFTWTPSLKSPVGTGFSIRITPVSHSEFYGESGSSFTMRKATLAVTSPGDGTTYARSSTMSIKWQKELANTGQIRIELYHNGRLAKVIISSTANDGSYSWMIPRGTVAGTYQIKISSTSDPTICAWSGSFYIR